MTFKTTLRKHQMLLILLGLIGGVYGFLIGLFGTVLSDYAPAFFSDQAQLIGNWRLMLVVVGGFSTFVFGWLIGDRINKIKEFNELMDTKSKSKFIKNIARIENLALTLGPQYEDKVIEKEEEYDIEK